MQFSAQGIRSAWRDEVVFRQEFVLTLLLGGAWVALVGPALWLRLLS